MSRLALPLTLLALALPQGGRAEARRARVSFLEGSAFREAGGKRQPLSRGVFAREGDRLETSAQGRLEITLPDQSVIRLGPSSALRLEAALFGAERRSFSARLLFGKVWAKVEKALRGESRFEISTERAVLGVRGTVFRIDSSTDQSTWVRVYSGAVAVASAAGGSPGQSPGERRPVPGPQKISRAQWEKSVGAMMQLFISPEGEAEEPRAFDPGEDAKDAWVVWNRERDGAGH